MLRYGERKFIKYFIKFVGNFVAFYHSKNIEDYQDKTIKAGTPFQVPVLPKQFLLLLFESRCVYYQDRSSNSYNRRLAFSFVLFPLAKSHFILLACYYLKNIESLLLR